MVEKQNLTGGLFQFSQFIKPMLIGGGIAMALIAFFLLPIENPDPAWPKYWMVRPFIIVTLAGAAGGAFFALMRPMRRQGGWVMVAGYVLSLIVYVIGLWLGTVLGLDGTLWN
jgi:hypothetical protein